MVKTIAEIGINHNGDLGLCKEMITLAKKAGADYVKFQKRDPNVCVPEDQKSKLRDTPWGEMTYLEYKHRIEFNDEFYEIGFGNAQSTLLGSVCCSRVSQPTQRLRPQILHAASGVAILRCCSIPHRQQRECARLPL